MSKIGKNIVYNVSGQGAVALLGFVALRFIYRRLGEDQLGVIFFTLTLNTILCAALELGICSTIVREVAAHGKSEPDYLHALIRTASFFYWCAFILLALLVNWSAPIVVTHWINLRTMTPTTAIVTMRILGTAALLSLPRSLLVSVFRGLERMEFNNSIDLAVSGLQQGGVAAILFKGGNLFTVIYWLAFTFLLWLALYVLSISFLIPWQSLVPGLYREPLHRTGGFSAQMAWISVVSLVHAQGDKMIVSKLLPVADLGFYGFASQLIGRASMLTNAVSIAAYPSLSASLDSNSHASAARQYHKLHDLICIGTVPVFAAIVFATVPLFSHIFSSEIAAQLRVPVFFLCLGQYMNGSMNMPYYFSLASGRPDIAVRWATIALLVSTLPTIWLTYHFGLSGAAFGWVLYHFLSYVYGVPTICRECLRITVVSWYWHVGKIALLTLVSYGPPWIICLASTQSNGRIALAFLLGSVIYLTGALFLMNRALRHELSRPILNLLVRSSA